MSESGSETVTYARYFRPEEFVCASLREWAAIHQNDPNRWSRSNIGKTIKEVVGRFDNWKNAPRGNPRKGAYASLAKRKGEQND